VKENFVKNLSILIQLALLLLLTPPTLAAPDSKAPTGAIKLSMELKGTLDGLSFHMKPQVIVLDKKSALLEIHRDDNEGILVSLNVLPTRKGKDRVDLELSFSVKNGKKEVSRELRFVTIVDEEGYYSIKDKNSKEFLDLKVTPSIVP